MNYAYFLYRNVGLIQFIKRIGKCVYNICNFMPYLLFVAEKVHLKPNYKNKTKFAANKGYFHTKTNFIIDITV